MTNSTDDDLSDRELDALFGDDRAPDHDLDPGSIDSLDEVSGDEQLMLIWCDTHHTYEWHWLPISFVSAARKPKRAR